MKIYSFLAILLSLIIFSACSSVSDNSSVSGNDTISVDTIKVEAVPEFEKDSIHDRIARFISGYDKMYEDTNKIDDVVWREFSKTINSNWKLIEGRRLFKMKKWEREYFRNQIQDSLLLFYPFSGPDFLHAYHLYPNAANYIMLANETIGVLPDFDRLTKSQISSYLQNINFFLRDIYKRSYFITGNMIEDINETSLKGILPIFYVFLSRTEHEILDVEKIRLNSQGDIISMEDSVLTSHFAFNGVRFTFRKQNEKQIKTLVYFNIDISDEGFDNKPELGLYLSKMGKCNTFVKSASYLMHYVTFSKIRNVCLEKSESIFQDDTGISYKYFLDGKRDITLFGAYEKPIKDFGDYLYQPDLEKAYHDTSITVLPIPFSLGYHWSTNIQNQMLAVKK